jgi:hypothetical protein
MRSARALLSLLLLSMLLALGPSGCGNSEPSQDQLWREEVNGSLANLEDSTVFRYDLFLQTWVGVSGHSVYGDEGGQGSYIDGDFTVPLKRTSPSGEEDLVFTYWKGDPYLEESGEWRPIGAEEVPSPLCDPMRFVKTVSGYGNITLEGEEELDGTMCRRYLLQLGGDRARDVLFPRAWSYFSNLRYELNCRAWIADADSPPVSLRLEVVGFDPDESLQRYRLLATLDPHDFGSADIQVTPPPIALE